MAVRRKWRVAAPVAPLTSVFASTACSAGSPESSGGGSAGTTATTFPTARDDATAAGARAVVGAFTAAGPTVRSETLEGAP